MRRNTIYFFVLGVAVVVLAALGSAGLVVSAQNSNSSSTMTNSKPKPKHRKKPAAAPAMGRCDNTKQEQTDLSGTYTGKLKHGDEPEMDGTLTITGNKFTMTTGSDTHSGTITAVTTCGYTAVTVMPDGARSAASLRAKKVGDNLTLTSVPGEPQKIWFSTGGEMKTKPRKHRTKAKTTGAAATPTP